MSIVGVVSLVRRSQGYHTSASSFVYNTMSITRHAIRLRCLRLVCHIVLHSAVIQPIKHSIGWAKWIFA